MSTKRLWTVLELQILICLRPVQVRASQQLARVVVPNQVLKEQGAYSLEADDTKHITKVLRCSTGDSLELVDGTGRLQEVRLAAVERATGRRPASAQVRTAFQKIMQKYPYSGTFAYQAGSAEQMPCP